MKVNTRVFGEIDILEEKIIRFVNGIVGFPELTEFALINNSEREGGSAIQWLQSIQSPEFAIPVMDPLLILPDYNPQIEDELVKPIGTLNPDDILVLVTVAVPKDITQMTVNLKGPIIINALERKACQVIAEGDNYSVKFPVYDIIQAKKGDK